MTTVRKPYPSDVSDEEWALVAPYVTLLRESAEQRQHSLREVFNGLRYLVRYGVAWRAMPNDLPPWAAVYQQAQRWLAAGCFEMLVHDLRAVLRLAAGRKEEPTAAVLDSRTLRSTPESGHRAAWDGYKRTRGSKLHMAVDTLGHLLAVQVTPANTSDRAAVAALAEAVQEATEQSVELAYVDQGYTGMQAEAAAAEHGIKLEVVKLAEARRGFVLLPRRWVVERHRQLGCQPVCGMRLSQVGRRDDDTCLPKLRRLPLPGRGHQPRRLALLPLPAQPAHGG